MTVDNKTKKQKFSASLPMVFPQWLFPFAQLPGSGDLFSYFVDFDTRRLEPWEKIIPSFKYSPEIPYFDLLVPTVDTVRYGFLMEKLLVVNRSVMFTGTTGVGKVR